MKEKILSKYIDAPARGGGGGLVNGLNSDDLDDDEYIDEDSEELMAIRVSGNRLGGQQILTDDDNCQCFCMFMKLKI